MMDVLGRRVLSEQYTVIKGKNDIQLDFKQVLMSGVYYLNIQMEGEQSVSTHKVIHIDNNGTLDFNSNNDDDDDDDDDDEQE